MKEYVLVAVLVFSIAVNAWAVIKLNRAYDKLADIFCIQDTH